MRQTAFDLFHPMIPVVYFVAVLLFCMAAMQPVYLGLSLVGAFSYTVFLRGWRAALRSARWQMPLVILIVVVNPLFSAAGSTELFKIGPKAVYAESLFYGFCMGMMLVAMMNWLSGASRVISFDKVTAIFGTLAPTVGLVISMAARLVPEFARRGDEIRVVQRACTTVDVGAADGLDARGNPRGRGRVGSIGAEDASGVATSKKSYRHLFSERARLVTVLMGWAMEDSIVASDAMRARGWGSTTQRSTYTRYRFTRYDAIALILVLVLVAGNAFLAVVACAQYSFYPTISTLVMWWGYLPYAVLVFLPLIAEATSTLRWKIGGGYGAP